MLKKTLIGFAVLVVALLGGVLVAPSFIDWNARLPEITAQVKQATGRELKIDGRWEVRILPAPMLTAKGISFGNAPEGMAGDMARLDAVEVRVAFMPLLSGDVQVERIRLVKPDIVIEKYADGRTNLEFSEQASSAVQGGGGTGTSGAFGGGGAASAPGVRLDNFEIIDGRVSYLDVASGTKETVEDLTATFRAASLEGCP